jgi:thymidylate kinase
MPSAQPEQSELALLIAVIGCDGSGKSSVSEAILGCVAAYGPVEAAHLGKQSGNIGRAIAGLPLVGRALDRVIVRKTDDTRAQRAQKNPGLVTALVISAFSLRRLRRFRRMMTLRRRGRIIVTDRYPQLEVAGAYDGPDLSVTATGSVLVRWLAQRERAAFEWMTSFPPDLVLRLNVDLDVACARKPDHRRELLAAKVAATPLLKFNGAPIAEIDANLPLDEVVAAARTAVTRTLIERGYSTSTSTSSLDSPDVASSSPTV